MHLLGADDRLERDLRERTLFLQSGGMILMYFCDVALRGRVVI